MARLKSEMMRLDPDQEWVTFRLGAIFVVSFSLFYLIGTWNRETFTVFYDSGRTLYAPTLILKGKVLYRDFDWMYGPLSPYLEAVIYRYGGISYGVLQIWGCLLYFFILILLYLVGSTLASPLIALVAILPFIKTSACWLGFVPYTFASTYGNFASLLAFWFLILHSRDSKRWRLAVVGIALGLCLASKLEFGMSAVAGTILYMYLRREKSASWLLLFAMTALIGLTPYLLLLRYMPASVLLAQLFPFWLAKIYHNDLMKEPNLLFLPVCSLIVFLLAFFKSGSFEPHFAHRPYREVTTGFFTFSFLIGMRALQGSWFSQIGPPYLAIAALAALSIQGIVRSVSPRFAINAAQAILLLVFFYSVKPLMLQYAEIRIDLPSGIPSHRMNALFLRSVADQFQQVAQFVKSHNRTRNLVALPYMPVFNYMTEMDSPIPRIFYLPGFLPNQGAEKTAIRQLENAGGALIITSNQYDEDQPLGFKGFIFGKTYDKVLWSYLERNYATYAVWKDNELKAVPGTPVGIEELAILAPRAWHLPDDSSRRVR